MAARSISEAKRVRYLLGLSFPAEREQIESEYFENEAAFQEMLETEEDLIDAYARDELVGDERRRFEKSFVSSLRGRERILFARAFADVASTTQPLETKLTRTWLDIVQSSGALRTATIAAVIVLVMVPTWLIIDRRITTNEFRELRAKSSDRGKTIQQSSDIEQIRAPKRGAQIAKLRGTPDEQRHRESVAHLTRRAPHLSAESFNTDSSVHENASSSGVSTLRGTATDPNGNLLSGATVTLTNSARNFTRTQITNKDGTYIFNAVPPGTYSMQVTARGFKTASVSDLTALVDTPTVRDVQLEIGDVSETVDVTSAAEAAINTSDATIGNSFEPKLITELPLNANDVVGLLSLQPSVSGTGDVNGRRTDQSNIMLDVVDGAMPFNWIRFRIALETAAIYENYRITIKTADGRLVTSVDWTEPLSPNQIIATTGILMDDLSSGDYVLSLMGKESDGSFVEIAAFRVIKFQ